LQISCDNPACPGNTLDPHDRTGWTFITAEVYGDPSGSYVFCCAACVSASSASSTAPAIFDVVKPEPAPA